jgi:N-acetylmuramoyl-L-alanine amidase
VPIPYAFVPVLIVSVASFVTVAAAPSASAGLQPGADGRAVERLTARLAELGYLGEDDVGRRFTHATRWAVMAFQTYEEIGVDGIVGPETRATLRRAERPAAPPGKRRRVAVSLSSQLAYLVGKRDYVRRAILVSTGRRGFRTPRGAFEVFWRERRSWSSEYGVVLPWAAYFRGGYAFHGSWTVPGRPTSHGCVRVPAPFARDVFGFARLGTKVVVRA